MHDFIYSPAGLYVIIMLATAIYCHIFIAVEVRRNLEGEDTVASSPIYYPTMFAINMLAAPLLLFLVVLNKDGVDITVKALERTFRSKD